MIYVEGLNVKICKNCNHHSDKPFEIIHSTNTVIDARFIRIETQKCPKCGSNRKVMKLGWLMDENGWREF